MKIEIKKMICIALVFLFIFSLNASALKITKKTDVIEDSQFDPFIKRKNMETASSIDMDPLVDLKVTVTIKEIRAFDKIDLLSDPDFYVKLIINTQEFSSDIWYDQNPVKEEWSQTVNVPDNREYVEIIIQLWDWNQGSDKICDIATNTNENPIKYDITVYYSLKTGHWVGDDMITRPHSWFVDYSGYGRASGTDDSSIYENDRDCELFFDISQNDYDGDGIPYWTEVEIFNTDPEIDDTGNDDDNDLVPIEWEYKWGYDLRWSHHNRQPPKHEWLFLPSVYDDHRNLDPDGDSLDNYEEYLTSEWGSDPYRKDIFVELDEMDEGPNGEPKSLLPEGSKELITQAFNRQNIVFHLDDGYMGGGEIIPFDNNGPNSTYDELNQMYYDYFLHDNESEWRKGVFHYGLVVYNASYHGFAFRNDAYQISRKELEKKAKLLLTGNRDVVYASAYMHELGHSLGLMWLRGHSTWNRERWLISLIQWYNYQSIMNYAFMYGLAINIVDFSDGSRGKNDYDDWSNIDFSYFDK